MMLARPLVATLIAVGLAGPATAMATQPCEPGPRLSNAGAPSTLEVPATAEKLCGLNGPVSTYTFEVIGYAISADSALPNQHYLLDFDDGRRAIWRTGDNVELNWSAKHAETIRPVDLDASPLALEQADDGRCYRMTNVVTGKHLLAVGARWTQPLHWVSTTIDVVQDEPEPVRTPILESIEAQEAPQACSEHGLYTATLASDNDGVWAYEWTIRDEQGRVVQEGTGLQPSALGQATETDGAFELGEYGGYGATKRPYHVGQTYEMEIRAVGFFGQASAPVTDSFVFEQTGEGSSWNGLVVVGFVFLVALQICAAISLGLILLFVRAVRRRRSA